LAVLAALVILILAAVFLTKPIEKTVMLGNMRNHDVVTIPKEDNPKEIVVTYQGKEYFFDESHYDTFRIFLEELEVYEEEVSKSRSEDRPAEIIISLEGKVFYNFDAKMEMGSGF
jgi:YHS domain-containing protein